MVSGEWSRVGGQSLAVFCPKQTFSMWELIGREGCSYRRAFIS
jgi:hypothetical protein